MKEGKYSTVPKSIIIKSLLPTSDWSYEPAPFILQYSILHVKGARVVLWTSTEISPEQMKLQSTYLEWFGYVRLLLATQPWICSTEQHIVAVTEAHSNNLIAETLISTMDS